MSKNFTVPLMLVLISLLPNCQTTSEASKPMVYFDFVTSNPSRFGVKQMQGYTDDEIIQLEREYHVHLPAAYKEFLRLCGKKTGQLLSSYHTTVDQIKKNIEALKFDMANTIHSNSFKIEPDMFFFGQWQGSVFYFRCDGNDNPPVYFISSLDDITVVNPTFTDFVKEQEDLK